MTDDSDRRSVKRGSIDSAGARGKWSNQVDYLVSLLGTVVGYGNLWRFPYLCSRNGGGAFLIPFLFFIFTCGLPLFFLEVSVGQFAGKSHVHIWSVCPLFKGIGIGQVVACGFTLAYYQNILAWSIYYMGMSCSRVLPWMSCNNSWNTDQCQDGTNTSSFNFNHTAYSSPGAQARDNATQLHADFYVNGSHTKEISFKMSHSDAEEFWQYKTLGVSEGVHHMGHVQWHLALCLFVSWLLIFLCLIKGVQSVGKVVYVTAVLPYILLTVLLIRTVLLPGAVQGIIFFLTPDFQKLMDVQVWLEALVQVFYSLGPGWGFLVSLSSYNRFHDNTLRTSVVMSLVGEGTSLFSGLVIFTILGFMANDAGVPIDDVATSGPGLGFVVYPEGLSTLPYPQLWAFLFFVMMITLGLDTQFAWTESMITAILDQFPDTLRKRRVLVTATLCVVFFLLGLPFTTEGGIYYFQILDWYAAAVCIIVFAITECIVFMWVYGSKRFNDDLELMLGRRAPTIFNVLLGYITPIFLSVSLVMIFWKFKPPTYGEYEYPVSCLVVGWIFAFLPVLPLPVMAAVALYRTKGTFTERLKKCTRPDDNWKPSSFRYREVYLNHKDTDTAETAAE